MPKYCYYFLHFLLILAQTRQQWRDVYRIPNSNNPTPVAKNQLLATISGIGNEWKVNFEFMATEFLENKDTNFLWIETTQGHTLVKVGVTKTNHIGFCFKLRSGVQRDCRALDGKAAARVVLNQWSG